MSHTPAPWFYNEEAVTDRANRVIAFPNDDVREMDDATCEANARLIAAAPELLEALQHALEDMHAEWATHGGTRQMICQAIAKATGGDL